MPPAANANFRRPAWNQAAIWMGADFFALLRLYAENRFHIPPSSWFDAAVDTTFSLANTGLRGLQSLIYSRKIAATQLCGDPIFIIGHWRTGTTLLHELLSLDTRHRYATTYECFVPNHFVLSEQFLKSWSGFALPGTRPPDNMRMGWDLPQEDEFALCNLGVPSPYLHIAFPNEPHHWDRYFELDELSEHEQQRWRQTLLTFLKSMTLHKPGTILLKSPTHTFRLPTLHAMFPNARFVYIIRNPYEVYPSTVNLWQSLEGTYGYQRSLGKGLEEYVLSTYVRLQERLANTRSLIPSNRFHELRFEDLVQDPVLQVRKIYEKLEMGDFNEIEPALRGYAAKNANYKRNRYELPAEMADTITHRWKKYIDEGGYSVQT